MPVKRSPVHSNYAQNATRRLKMLVTIETLPGNKKRRKRK
jgi:hypothetical protein